MDAAHIDALEHVGKVFDAAPYPVFICDTKANIIYANRVALGVYESLNKKTTPQQWPSVTELYDNDDKPIPARSYPMMRAIAGEIISDEQYWVVIRNTKERFKINVDAHPIRDDHGKIIGALSLHRVTRSQTKRA